VNTITQHCRDFNSSSARHANLARRPAAVKTSLTCRTDTDVDKAFDRISHKHRRHTTFSLANLTAYSHIHWSSILNVSRPQMQLFLQLLHRRQRRNEQTEPKTTPRRYHSGDVEITIPPSKLLSSIAVKPADVQVTKSTTKRLHYSLTVCTTFTILLKKSIQLYKKSIYPVSHTLKACCHQHQAQFIT